MSYYLSNRIPSATEDLSLGVHWVWKSFRLKVEKIATMMVLSNHIIPFIHLKNRKRDECILNSENNFFRVEQQELDGNYLVLDVSRNKIIRSGCALKGMYSRWKSHITA